MELTDFKIKDLTPAFILLIWWSWWFKIQNHKVKFSSPTKDISELQEIALNKWHVNKLFSQN